MTMSVPYVIELRISLDASRTTSIAGRGSGAAVLLQPALHVLHIDDRIVDELADRDRDPAERHRVDRDAEDRHDDGGHEERERDGRQRDDRRAHVEQEQEQHDRHDDAAVAQGPLDVGDRRGDEIRLPEDLTIDLDVARQ